MGGKQSKPLQDGEVDVGARHQESHCEPGDRMRAASVYHLQHGLLERMKRKNFDKTAKVHRGLTAWSRPKHLPRALSSRTLLTALLCWCKVHEIEQTILRGSTQQSECPRDGKPGCAYVDMLKNIDDVGRAQYMLSYSTPLPPAAWLIAQPGHVWQPGAIK